MERTWCCKHTGLCNREVAVALLCGLLPSAGNILQAPPHAFCAQDDRSWCTNPASRVLQIPALLTAMPTTHVRHWSKPPILWSGEWWCLEWCEAHFEGVDPHTVYRANNGSCSCNRALYLSPMLLHRPAPEPGDLFDACHVPQWSMQLALYFPLGCVLASTRMALWVALLAVDQAWLSNNDTSIRRAPTQLCHSQLAELEVTDYEVICVAYPCVTCTCMCPVDGGREGRLPWDAPLGCLWRAVELVCGECLFDASDMLMASEPYSLICCA